MSVKCRKSNNYDVEFIEVIENINCHAQSFHFINGFENLPELKFKGLGQGSATFWTRRASFRIISKCEQLFMCLVCTVNYLI